MENIIIDPELLKAQKQAKVERKIELLAAKRMRRKQRKEAIKVALSEKQQKAAIKKATIASKPKNPNSNGLTLPLRKPF